MVRALEKCGKKSCDIRAPLLNVNMNKSKIQIEKVQCNKRRLFHLSFLSDESHHMFSFQKATDIQSMKMDDHLGIRMTRLGAA